MESVSLDGKTATTEDVTKIARAGVSVDISSSVEDVIRQSRSAFEKLASSNMPIYGVTTGYGEMVYASVGVSEETVLQTNLVRSHCAGTGPLFSESEARAIMVARLNSLIRGYSAVRMEVVNQIRNYLNAGVTPAVPEIGSLGASGDLGPLSHMAITLIGEGYVLDSTGCRVPTEKVLSDKGISAISLKFKEGLSLINGTSAMTGLMSLLVEDAKSQVATAEIISAFVLEVMKASSSAFLSVGHDIARPHQGQIDSAWNIRKLIAGSSLVVNHEDLRMQMESAVENSAESVTITDVYLQKAYTLRCIPQIIGAVRDTIVHAENVVTTELNSSNDNPLFFEGEEVFHGGNFHGQPIAFVADFMGVAMIQVGVLSERRVNRLLNKSLSGLPEFLISGTPGLRCGMEGLQYPATATVAENRTLAVPASIQSIPSNSDNQDVVSMGLVSARKTRQILENNWTPLAVEAMAALQAARLTNAYAQLSRAGQATFDALSQHFRLIDEDRYLTDDLNEVITFIKAGGLIKAVNSVGVQLR